MLLPRGLVVTFSLLKAEGVRLLPGPFQKVSTLGPDDPAS